MRTGRGTTRQGLVAALLLLAACEAGDAPGAAVVVERDTVGDTLIVRTLSGSAWGRPLRLEPDVRIGTFEGDEAYMFGSIQSLAAGPDGSIYVMDGQVPALRKYDASGRYVGTFGRAGGGPGEYQRPDGGLAVLADGRVVLRDPGNARLQVYSADGEPLDAWRIRGGFNTSNPLVVDTGGRVYTQVLLDPTAAVTEWRSGMVAHDPLTGEPGDTLPGPAWNHQAPRLVATSADGAGTSVNSVPFSPAPHWALSPLGHMVGGVSTRYAVDQYLPDGAVVRIERVHEPTRVQDGERANQEERTRWSMRQTQPDWRWNGPAIPGVKPAYRRIYVARDGRIWVLLHQPGEPLPPEMIEEPREPDGRPPLRWREPVVFDVFESDGTYLGEVRAPDDFSLSPTPVFDGDQVLAVVRDELDVQYVVRFRMADGEDR